ncbi:helix-turn-helix transcriptional regulator [Marinobacter sp. C2H3]|uniref:helix-turn-helix transcriptional regulator n=1 Tax=Marinobacter sp. C2H3 TaxID=3119003 RepID=UPI00300F36BC
MLDARLLKLPLASHQHRHEHHQIVVGVRGEADLSVDGTNAHLDTWKACLVPTEARHDFCGDPENHVLVINLDPYAPPLNSPMHSEYERLAPMFERPRVVALDSRLQAMVQFTAQEFDRSPDNPHLQRHLAAGLLHCLAGHLRDVPAVAGRSVINPDMIRRYVMENLHRRIRVEDLAGIACLSVSRFHEMFREVTGVTPHQFVIGIRIDQAVQLLCSTPLSVSEVSYRTGFSSQSALTNALRQHRGTTPSRLRQAATGA